jgi:hypothetical protein
MNSAAVVLSVCASVAQASTGNYQYPGQQQQAGRLAVPEHERYRYPNSDPYQDPYAQKQQYGGAGAQADQPDPYYQYNSQQQQQQQQQRDPYDRYDYNKNAANNNANNNYNYNNNAANNNNNAQGDPYKYEGHKYNNMYDDHDWDDDHMDTWNHDAPKPVGDADSNSFNAQVEEEFEQDFIDFDLNRDNVVDPLEVRSHFQNEVSADELAQFWYDVDLDNSGTITWSEYREYAKQQYGSMEL